MKNELEAVLQFIKFFRLLRNLAVTDATLNATLENTREMIVTFLVCGLPSLILVCVCNCLISKLHGCFLQLAKKPFVALHIR